MKNKLEQLRQEALKQLEDLKESKSLKNQKEIWRALEIKYLGRKGQLSQILRQIKDLSTSEKKEVGAFANKVKTEIAEAFSEFENKFLSSKAGQSQVDMSLPGKRSSLGHLHPITLMQRELEELFKSLGFSILEGPELESDYYNFQALNIPEHHPARDMQDTFYVNWEDQEDENKLVLRTHTSPVQVRAMQEFGAPLKAIVPGKVFRNEALDASHEHTFYQLEGIMIDKNISISNMIAVMKELLKGIFKEEVEIRIRPGFFPFVEPGIEIDMKCRLCQGQGCPVCKQSGWLEVFPGGMIHPNVLEAGGIDSKKYSGFAFGLGLTRLAMMKHGIADIRLFNSGDLRFLEQF
ncbi:MAG: phenylalanine--tRNA ligase subunit alpha [Candidatus Pacebacteria bacterium]|nr:phenylalanine--tRNA ligase subunit alpha [Candidatus Paceibacterota bacterium]